MGGGRRDLGDGVWVVLAGGGDGLLGAQDRPAGNESSVREAARPRGAGGLQRRESPAPALLRERVVAIPPWLLALAWGCCGASSGWGGGDDATTASGGDNARASGGGSGGVGSS